MKSKITTALVLLLSAICYSQTENDKIQFEQNDKIVYMDSMHQISSAKDHQFYKIIKDYQLDKSSYSVYEFNKSGVLQIHAISSNKEGFPLIGARTFYYKNGNKKKVTNYIKNRPNGKDVQWYENGNKKIEGEYIIDDKTDDKKNASRYKINQFWDINGVQKVTDGNGFFDSQDEKESSKGEIKNGFKEGIWEGSNGKENISYTEIYKNGIITSGVSTDIDGKKYKYTELEVRPEPKNGIMDFYEFIGKNYRTPEIKGFSGKVHIQFVVDINGKIIKPKVLRDLGYGTGEEAIRVVSEYDGFEPGEKRGKKTRFIYSLPINIKSNL